jgi:hypothetical protein
LLRWLCPDVVLQAAVLQAEVLQAAELLPFELWLPVELQHLLCTASHLLRSAAELLRSGAELLCSGSGGGSCSGRPCRCSGTGTQRLT